MNAGNRTESCPPVVCILVLVNLLAFICVALISGEAAPFSAETLSRFGGNDHRINLQPWRLLTCTFLHLDAIGLLTNMWWLIWAAPFVERRFGSSRFAVFYLLCALFASIASAVWHPNAVGVGASGGVWGVWGLVVAMFIFDRLTNMQYAKVIEHRRLVPVFIFIVFSLIVDLGTADQRPNIDTAAHLGGLAAGTIVGGLVLVVAFLHRGRRLDGCFRTFQQLSPTN